MSNDLLQQILSELKEIKESQIEMQTTQKSMQSQLEEHGLILRALEHKTDVVKANQEVIRYDVAEIKGEVVSVRTDINAVEYVTGKNMSDIARLKSVK